MFCCIQCRTLKAHIKTHGAADAFLRFIFHAFSTFKPVVCVVVTVYKRNIMLFGKADIFLFADFIFFNRMDIGIIKKIEKSIPDSIKVSITSPEQGAQQECSKSLSWPAGSVRFWRLSLLDIIIVRFKSKPYILAIHGHFKVRIC